MGVKGTGDGGRLGASWGRGSAPSRRRRRPTVLRLPLGAHLRAVTARCRRPGSGGSLAHSLWAPAAAAARSAKPASLRPEAGRARRGSPVLPALPARGRSAWSHARTWET